MSGQDWAGRLRERITIEQATPVADELGGQSITWETLASCWAEVVPLNSAGRERDDASQVAASAGYRVLMRYREDVDASMRLQWRSHTLAIHSLHERKGILELLTYEESL